VRPGSPGPDPDRLWGANVGITGLEADVCAPQTVLHRGTDMVSIDEVAKLAGLSTATVSRALSGRGHVSPASRERVHVAAEALGYVVSSQASGLATGRTRNVGVIVPLLDRWFFSTVLSGVTSTLMRAGYDITLYNITADAAMRREVVRTFLRRQIGRA